METRNTRRATVRKGLAILLSLLLALALMPAVALANSGENTVASDAATSDSSEGTAQESEELPAEESPDVTGEQTPLEGEPSSDETTSDKIASADTTEVGEDSSEDTSADDSLPAEADADESTTASISGELWLDADRDAVHDGDEASVANYPVSLYAEDATLLATTETDAAGVYEFTHLEPGSYYTQVKPHELAADEYLLPQEDLQDDNQFITADDGQSANSSVIELVESEAITGIDAGMCMPLSITALGAGDPDWARLREAIETHGATTVTIYPLGSDEVEDLENGILVLTDNMNFINSDGTPITVSHDVTLTAGDDAITLITADDTDGRHFNVNDDSTFAFDEVIIDGKDLAGGINHIGGALTLKGAVIQNCVASMGGGVFSQGSSLTLNNCTISGNTAAGSGPSGGTAGGIIGGYGGGAYADNSTSIEVSNSTISGNIAGGAAGGLYAQAPTVTIANNSSIDDNEALLGAGGGAWICSNTFSLTGGSVSNNAASEQSAIGGGLYVTVVYGGTSAFTLNGTTVSGNYAGAKGGGIYVDGDTVGGITFTMKSGTISGNSTISGGGVYFEPRVSFLMEAGAISGNSAQNGGGVYAEDDFSMTGGIISGNECEYFGGGLYADGGIFTMTGGAIGDVGAANTAGSSGGGVYITDDSTFAMSAGTISNNVAVYNGGGVYVRGGAITGGSEGVFAITGTAVISGNYAANGGGVYVIDEGSFVMSGDAAVSNNNASDGGGVYVRDASFEMTGEATVSSNNASNGGGGVYAYDSSIVTMSSSSTISDNMATYYGGGAYVTKGSTFEMNDTAALSGSSAGWYGGGVYVVNNSSFDMSGDATVTDNTTPYYGGGIYVSSGGTVTISDTVAIANNTAALYGGGVYITDVGSTLTIEGGAISSNTATQYGGGGMYLGNGSLAAMSGGEISGNKSIGTSYGFGGGVYLVNASTFEMSAGAISDNTSTSYGGGVYASNGTVDISGDATVNGNTAAYYGGGVYMSNGSLSLSDEATLSNNTTAYYGGGVYLSSGSLTMDEDAAVTDNEAYSGGGIYVSPSASAVINGGTISGNTALKNGGGVWVTDTYTDLENVTVAAEVTFSGNVAATSSDRVSADDAIYNEQIGTDGAGVTWTDPFTQGYNNYDISYVRAGYTVAYVENWPGGAVGTSTAPLDTKLYAEASPVTVLGPGTLASTGYTFMGWATSATAPAADYPYDQSTATFSPSSFVMPAANTTLYAVWKANTNTAYKVEHYLVSSAGTSLAVAENFSGTTDTPVSAGIRSFTGYTHDATHPSSVLAGTIASDGSTVLKAYYRINVYTVTFVDWNGTILSTQTVEYGSGATAPTSPSRTGYTFIGWDRDFSYITSNLTVTAQYTPIPNPPVPPNPPVTPDPPVTYYTVTYLPGEHGTFVDQVTNGLTLGTATPAAPDATGEEGWIFTGWSPEPSATVTGNATYTAQWAPANTPVEMLTVRFVDWDGTLIKTEQVARGGNATAPAEPTREGHSFLRWDRSFTNVQANITVTAQYVVDAEFGGENPPLAESPDAPSVNIFGTDVPLFGSAGTASWSLFDLICTILAVLFALVSALRFILARKNKEDEEERRKKALYNENVRQYEYEEKVKHRRLPLLIIAVVLAILAVLLFIFTQDMTQPMVIFDWWSIFFAIAAVLAVIAAVLTVHKKKVEETFDENEMRQPV